MLIPNFPKPLHPSNLKVGMIKDRAESTWPRSRDARKSRFCESCDVFSLNYAARPSTSTGIALRFMSFGARAVTTPLTIK